MDHLLNMLIDNQTLIVISNTPESTNTIYNILVSKDIIFLLQLMFGLKSVCKVKSKQVVQPKLWYGYLELLVTSFFITNVSL
jgi:hypothetical protein